MKAESVRGVDATLPTLLVVSASPERADFAANAHLAGARGRWLRDQIASRWRGRVVFDYAVRCYVGKGSPNRTWFDACRGYLARTLEAARPERILLVGPHAAQGLLGRAVDAYSARRAWAFLPTTKAIAYAIDHPYVWWGNKTLQRQVEEILDWALLHPKPTPPPLDAVARRWSPAAHADFAKWLGDAEELAYDIETYGRRADADFRVLAVALAEARSRVAWFWTEEDLAPGSEGAEALAEALASKKLTVGHNRKFDDAGIRRHFAVPDPPGARFDTMLDWRLLAGDAYVSLETLQDVVGMGGSKDEVAPHLEAESARLRREAKEDAKATADPEAALKRMHKYNEPLAYAYAAVPRDVLAKYCAKDAFSTAHIRARSKRDLSLHEELERTMGELIMPLSDALGRMEENGVRVVRQHARDLQRYFDNRKTLLLAELSEIAAINWKSAKQLQELLYGKPPVGFGLAPPWLTTGGAPATDKAALDKLKSQVPFIGKLLAFRSVDKLSTTYAWGLERFICDDGRIHTSYQIHGAETGRLSCVSAWTPIETARGKVEIQHLLVGDFVWTHRGRWRRVTRVFTKGPGDMVDVWFTNGEVLTCTLDHRILDAVGEWRRVEKVVDEYLEAVGRGGGESGGRLAALPRVGDADDRGDRGASRDDVSQRPARYQDVHDQGGKPDSREGAIFCVEVWNGESYEGKGARSASRLEGGGRRRERLPDDPRQRPAGVRPQGRDGGGTWAGEATEDLGRPPHRWGSEEQLYGQPRAGHCAWAQGDSRAGVGGVAGFQVEAIYYRGRLEVYDLSVEEDESYLACGVFSHNSKAPNLQNIPSGESDDPERAKDGKRIKDLFLASDRCEFVMADFSQLEIRVAAMLSQDPDMLAVLASGVDFHMASGRLIAPVFKEDPDAVVKGHWLRKGAKVVNFALLYGKGDHGIAEDLGISVSMAAKLRTAILGRFRRLARYIEERHVEALRTGGVWIPRFGDVRSRHRPLPHVHSRNPKEVSNARNAAVNSPIQGCGSEYMLASIVGMDMVLNGIPLNEWQSRSGHWEHVDAARRRYHKALKGRAKLVLTVHDSGGGDVRREVVPEFAAMMRDVMEGWPSPGVALPVDLSRGASWGSLEEFKP